MAVPDRHRGRLAGRARLAASDASAADRRRRLGEHRRRRDAAAQGSLGQGTALSFVVVASLSTAILLLGWRVVAAALARR